VAVLPGPPSGRVRSARCAVVPGGGASRDEASTTSNEQRATSNEADEWPIEDLIGCTVEGVGTVTGVLQGLSCDLLEVGDELIPLVTDAVTRIDVENKVIEVNREFLGL
jgi:ribosomal 30S subunit maturation factor RimM